MHVDHCIETIRKNLMCTADVTPFFTIMDDTAKSGKRPDFNTQHKCRNFDKLKDWMRGHTAIP
jgi:Mycotoxin biosynthesis protein UstYa